jgi:hypothetical protein
LFQSAAGWRKRTGGSGERSAGDGGEDDTDRRGGIERDGVYLAIKEARAEEAQEEVEAWLRKIQMLR